MANSGDNRRRYDAAAAEQRWQRYWEEHGTFVTRDDDAAERRYLLDMFSYPSGDLHMGHAEAWAISDVLGRYWKMRGHDVMHPIGWDSFGLPAENAAIRRNAHPASWTYTNIETQAQSFRRYGVAVDWTRRLHTSDPEYYRWTQWFFLRFFERGLAYRRHSFVNWCPSDQTVLANEQVVAGACERCGGTVSRRRMNQWYFRITDYAQRLLDDMALIADGWPPRVLTMQRQWIGRSEGAYVDFAVEGRPEPVTVFTTRPDTLYGVTFLAVAPEGDLAGALCTPERLAGLSACVEGIMGLSDVERESGSRERTGVFLGAWAVHPLTEERIPVWAAEHVLPGYGTGAVMGVPAHDQRDLEFALAYDLRVQLVVDTGEPFPAETGVAAVGDGTYVDSGPLDGLTDRAEAVGRVCALLEVEGAGRAGVNYRLRDWLISRQRYWGCPIPIIHCPACGEVPVPDNELPVELPDLRGADLAPRGTSPLAAASDWVNVACPSCGRPASRDTDTMDTFVDSSWYFFRYCSPTAGDRPFDAEAVSRWMPVARYVGGAEHATMHLLYCRFFTKVLYDMGLVSFAEPMRRLLNQGQVINDGRAMSKSLGNGVDLGEQLDAYGVDAVRLTLLFAGPPEADIDWSDLSPASSVRFLKRAHRVACDVGGDHGGDQAAGDLGVRRTTHALLAQITSLLERDRFNVAVARLMELVNALRKAIDSGPGVGDPAVREGAEVAAAVLCLFAPYVAEEMWEALGKPPSVAESRWPLANPELTVSDTVTCVVQVQGKVKATLDVDPSVGADELTRLALEHPAVRRAAEGRAVQRVVVREPALVNVVLQYAP